MYQHYNYLILKGSQHNNVFGANFNLSGENIVIMTSGKNYLMFLTFSASESSLNERYYRCDTDKKSDNAKKHDE